MKIAVCTIVVNGEDYIKEWIENYLPIADYVCIAEGATQNWIDAHGLQNPESTDKTKDIISKYCGSEKVKVHFATKPYKDKCEQTNAFMRLVPDDVDYILYADSDEFYLHSDYQKLKNILVKKTPLMMQVYMYHFWKGIDYIGVGGDSWAYDTPIPRIFKFEKGSTFVSHRPPTTSLMESEDFKHLPIITAKEHDIICRHYSYVTKKQVYEKMPYYEKTFNREYMDWVKNVFDVWTPENKEEIEAKFSIHPTGSNAKTKKIDVEHPEVIDSKFNIVKSIFIGTEYGGNIIPSSVLNKDSIVYSFGLGEDASFDIGLIELYGCNVKIFDPTPRSVIFYQTQLSKYPQISFNPIGLWDKNTEVKFYEPKDKSHVSHSIQNLQETNDGFVASVKRLVTIMENQHDKHIDVLKIDIEGAEYDVLNDMILCDIKPNIICAEFHCTEKNENIIKELESFGYKILTQEKNQCTLILK